MWSLLKPASWKNPSTSAPIPVMVLLKTYVSPCKFHCFGFTFIRPVTADYILHLARLSSFSRSWAIPCHKLNLRKLQYFPIMRILEDFLSLLVLPVDVASVGPQIHKRLQLQLRICRCNGFINNTSSISVLGNTDIRGKTGKYNTKPPRPQTSLEKP